MADELALWLLPVEQLVWFDVEHVAECFEEISAEQGEVALGLGQAIGGGQADPPVGSLGELVGGHPSLVEKFG